jgi:dipeptidyl aminopeptidase/acylaminoacyl peptidase
MIRSLFCATSMVALFSSAAHAETLEETAAAFGARQTVLDVSLSPSGNKLLYLAPGSDSAEIVYVVDLAGEAQPKAVTAQRGLDSKLARCEWATDKRMICQARYIGSRDGLLIGASRLFALDDDGKNHLNLSAQDNMNALGIRQDGGKILALDLPDRPGRVLMTREWVKEYSTGTKLANTDEGLGVVEVDIANGRRRNAEAPSVGNVDFIADDKGQLRIRIRQPLDSRGYMRPEPLYSFRDANARGWQPLSDTRDAADGAATFFPAAVDAARNVAYGFVSINGYDAVTTVALDGTGRSEVVLSRDDVDVDSLIRIGRQRRVVGASYATEKREIAYFDDELGRLAEQFHKVLPGEPLVEVVGASANERQLLLIGSSDVDPGMVYLFDKDTRELSGLMPLRRELAGRQMGAMRPVTFPAADGTMIPGYLTLPPGLAEASRLPTIVLPHGGPSARDEWGFDWLVQFFAARGYAVLQPNFRGSTGYGSAWFGRNGFQAWRTAIGDVNDAGRWLVSEGIADPAKLAIVGWSYGGYAALQSQVLDNALYKAVVAIAPVTDLDRFREEKRPYTTFRIVDQFVGQGAHVAEGSPARNAATFAAPVLMFHGTLDQNVGVSQARLMKSRLEEAGKEVRYVEYAGYDHQLDEGSVRTDMLTDIGRFLEASLGR